MIVIVEDWGKTHVTHDSVTDDVFDEFDGNNPNIVHWIEFGLLLVMAGLESPFNCRLKPHWEQTFRKNECFLNGSREIGSCLVSLGVVPKFDKKTLTSHGRTAMCQVVHFDHWRKVVDWLRENVIANIEEEGLAKKENDIEKAKEPENGSF